MDIIIRTSGLFFLYFNRLLSEAGEPNLQPSPPAPFVVTTSVTVIKDKEEPEVNQVPVGTILHRDDDLGTPTHMYNHTHDFLMYSGSVFIAV